MIDKYRQVFLNSPLGLDVLTDLLTELGFGSTLDPEKPYQVHQHNLAVVLLAKCGIFGKGTMRDVVASLASVSPEIITEKVEDLQ
jgi:hypothetical protein